MTVVPAGIVAALFALMIFPIHIYNYVYINTAEKYASINIGVYKFNFFNANTVKNKLNVVSVNGKDKEMDGGMLKVNFYRLFNQLCIYKIVQLGDFGVDNPSNAYALLAQYAATTALYKLIQINGNYCKLRNYTIVNSEHDCVRYYAKAVTIVNLWVVSKIFLIFLMEKLNERKIKKKQRQGL